jgi:hypothetical protein
MISLALRHPVSFFSSVATSAAMNEQLSSLLIISMGSHADIHVRRCHPRATSAGSGLTFYA